FKAKNLSATVSLLQNEIQLNDVSFNHAGGSFAGNGSLTDDESANHLKFSARLNHVNIPEVFNSFNNFGQDAITDKNMRGILSANITMSGWIEDTAVILPNSLNGTVDFDVQNGELINFEPVQKISETAFKK